MPLDLDFLEDVEKTFAAYLTMEQIQGVVEDAVYNAILAALQGGTRQQILDAARERAAELVTNVSRQMRDRMAEIIAQGLDAQLGVDGTARWLRDGMGLDSNRAKRLDKYRQSLIDDGLSDAAVNAKVEKYRKQLINERARTIAQNEMAMAVEDGNFQQAKSDGGTHKSWITVNADTVCSVCAGNQAQGPIPIDEPFQSGHMFPPGHPAKCRCTNSYLKDTGRGELERAKKRAEERAARLEETYDDENAEG
jgi:hypothetical protein